MDPRILRGFVTLLDFHLMLQNGLMMVGKNPGDSFSPGSLSKEHMDAAEWPPWVVSILLYYRDSGKYYQSTYYSILQFMLEVYSRTEEAPAKAAVETMLNKRLLEILRVRKTYV